MSTNLGNLIKNGREVKDLTQDELALALGKTQQTVSRWESNKIIPGWEIMPKIANVLDVDYDELALAASANAQARSLETDPEPTWREMVEQRLERLEAAALTPKPVRPVPLQAKARGRR